MKCVAQDQCGCYAEMLRYEIGQSVPTNINCQIWYVYYNLLSSSTVQYSDTGKVIHDLLTGVITFNCSIILFSIQDASILETTLETISVFQFSTVFFLFKKAFHF